MSASFSLSSCCLGSGKARYAKFEIMQRVAQLFCTGCSRRNLAGFNVGAKVSHKLSESADTLCSQERGDCVRINSGVANIHELAHDPGSHARVVERGS